MPYIFCICAIYGLKAQDTRINTIATTSDTTSMDSLGNDLALNSFELASRNEFFSDGIPNRFFIYFQYGRKLGPHELFLRLNSVHRPGIKSGLSYEADFYPKFDDKTYGYFAFAYSNSPLFPRFRTGAEVIRVFNVWEIGLGVRTSHPPDYDIFAITSFIGLYHGNWFTYFRPTLSFLEDGVASNFVLSTRRYSGDGKSYYEFQVVKGTDTGVTRDFNAIENSFGFDTWVVRFKVQKSLNELTTLSGGIDYSGLFIPQRDKYSKIFGFDVILRRYFK